IHTLSPASSWIRLCAYLSKAFCFSSIFAQSTQTTLPYLDFARAAISSAVSTVPSLRLTPLIFSPHSSQTDRDFTLVNSLVGSCFLVGSCLLVSPPLLVKHSIPLQ